MPILGAFLRVEADRAAVVRESLARLPGVEPFDLDDAGKLGLVIEAPDLDAARDLVERAIPRTAGVLAVWPVFVNNEDALPALEAQALA